MCTGFKEDGSESTAISNGCTIKKQKHGFVHYTRGIKSFSSFMRTLIIVVFFNLI